MSARRSAPILGRLPLRDRAEAIARINRFATLGHPFLFLVNYAAEHAVVEPLDALAPNALAYDFGGVTNLSPESPQRAVPHASLFDEPPPRAHPEDAHGRRLPPRFRHRAARFAPRRLLLDQPHPVRSHRNVPHARRHLRSSASPLSTFRARAVGLFLARALRPHRRRPHPHLSHERHAPRRRGAAERLMADAKEAAEHATVVDLLRNDLSRVAEHVRVERYRYVERVITHRGPLLQTSSEIAGRLPADYSAHLGEILFRLLPAGSVTGAPKSATCRLIAEAEGYDRGWYTGIAGWSDGRTLDSAVLIRFVEQTPEGLVFKAGGGVTAHSREEHEYAEIRDKIYIPF